MGVIQNSKTDVLDLYHSILWNFNELAISQIKYVIELGNLSGMAKFAHSQILMTYESLPCSWKLFFIFILAENS